MSDVEHSPEDFARALRFHLNEVEVYKRKLEVHGYTVKFHKNGSYCERPDAAIISKQVSL